MQKAHEVADLIKPYVVRWINEATVIRGSKSASSGEVSGGGALPATISAQTGNTTTGARHTHQVDAVSSVLTPTEKLLKTSASGYLNVIRLGVNRVPEMSIDACGGLFVRGNEIVGSGSGVRLGYLDFSNTGYLESRAWSASVGVEYKNLDILGGNIHLRADGHGTNGIYITTCGVSGYIGVNDKDPTHALTVQGDIRLAAGSMIINDSTNAQNTKGLTLNQLDTSNEILSIKSSCVAHDMTAIAETNTYGLLTKAAGATGGTNLTGLTAGSIGLMLRGISSASTGGRGTAANAPIVLRASYKSDTSGGSFPANANLLVVRDDTLARLILDSDGDLHLDASSNASAFDAYDDVGLLTGLRASLTPDDSELRNRFSEWIEYAREPLERAGVITYNDDGHHFVAMKKLAMLQIDATRQLHAAMSQMGARIGQLEATITALTSACPPLLT